MLNENNITKTVMTASMPILGGSETEEVSYSYTYDGDWPLSQTFTETDEDEDYRRQATTTRYFEYK
jgi:hypothetical protein